MARPAKPWYWKARKIWCITHKGERIILGPDREEAFHQYHQIMAKPDQEYHPIPQGAVAAILDDFLAWTEENRAPKTYTRYRDFIQSFVSKYGRMDAEDLNPDGSVRNRYSGQTGEYDLEGKAVSLSGDVRLHLGKDVELSLETLHYDLKKQYGYSDDTIELHSPQANGTARGVRYDNLHRQIELLSDLAFTVHRTAPSPGRGGRPSSPRRRRATGGACGRWAG